MMILNQTISEMTYHDTAPDESEMTYHDTAPDDL